MKKSVCLMAILGALGASSVYAAQNVIINFKGEVRDNACIVSLVNGSTTLQLGHISTASNTDDKGDAYPVVFKLTGCGLGAGAGKAPTIALNQDMTLTPEALGNSSVTDGRLGTDHSKVVVQFGNDQKKDELPKPTTLVDKNDGENYYIQYGYAYLKAVQDSPEAKEVNAKALFTVTYQ